MKELAVIYNLHKQVANKQPSQRRYTHTDLTGPQQREYVDKVSQLIEINNTKHIYTVPNFIS